MAEVKVLIEGYDRDENGAKFASASTVLIKKNRLNIIVDPGMNRAMLLDSLKKEGLLTSQVDYIILTHYHIDHSILSGIFENAKFLDDDGIYSQNGKMEGHNGKVPGTDIEIIKTPGHEMFHCSVLVKTKTGKIAISGDIFWWAAGQKQVTDKESLIKLEDLYVKNKEQLIDSRKRILEVADYIIPGHGKMFKIN